MMNLTDLNSKLRQRWPEFDGFQARQTSCEIFTVVNGCYVSLNVADFNGGYDAMAAIAEKQVEAAWGV